MAIKISDGYNNNDTVKYKEFSLGMNSKVVYSKHHEFYGIAAHFS